jgi:hypothetical protein
MNYQKKILIETYYLNSLQDIGFIDKWHYLQENEVLTDLEIEFNFHDGQEGFDECGYGTVVLFQPASLLNDKCLYTIYSDSNFIKTFLHHCREKKYINNEVIYINSIISNQNKTELSKLKL